MINYNDLVYKVANILIEEHIIKPGFGSFKEMCSCCGCTKEDVKYIIGCIVDDLPLFSFDDETGNVTIENNEIIYSDLLRDIKKL